MKKSEFRQKWIKEFAPNLSVKDFKNYIKDNYLWNVCCYKLINYTCGKQAINKFYEHCNEEVIVINMDSDEETYLSVCDFRYEDISHCENIITSKDFSWTFISTHEDFIDEFLCLENSDSKDFGPYFIIKS